MVAASIVRRAQYLAQGLPDPLLDSNTEELNDMNEDKITLLRLVYVLERGLNSKMSPHSAIEWTLARSSVIDNLKNAILGDLYHDEKDELGQGNNGIC